MSISREQINLFQSLFKGRRDIYAKRWEKGGKRGYMPAYDVNWEAYDKHKAQGGTFQNFKDKTPSELTSAVIERHMTGKETVGIYPLLKNNTSWFLAADFDGKNWMDESRRFLEACDQHEIPAYLERSRSGNGCHVWIFFEKPYPAWKSRKIAFHMLRKAEILSEFEKDGSFDRLFPNQNDHSGKGFGNLIALPLNKNRMAEGNTCFIDPETGEAFNDQWAFLEGIERVSVSHMNQVFSSIGERSQLSHKTNSQTESGFEIILDNQVWLNRHNIPPEVIRYIREELNFINSDYLMKKKMGRSTWKTEKYFKLIWEQDEMITLP